ncbi:MAG TPA: hypothetical protein VMJ70_01955 [Candidatus Sulfotelmatobacter sp.]|nr:hypothetical protein [Candidatus Sulfotelmatobacter sp.]
MHFLDAWSSLSLLDQLRLIAPAALMVAAILLPGRRAAIAVAFALAIAVPVSDAAGEGWATNLGWGLLWAGVGLVLVRGSGSGMRRPVEGAGGFESSVIGLMLGIPFCALLTLAIARQDLSSGLTRTATIGVLYLTLGLIHLMVRRHVLRSALGWGFVGFGLQVLEGAVRATLPPALAPPSGVALLATFVTLALVLRLGLARARWVGSAWLSDAHDLHD